MRCPSCFKEIDDIDSYCRWCGKALSMPFYKKKYALISIVIISLLIVTYIISLFVNFDYFFNSLIVQLILLLISGIALSLSIIGIVHANACKKYLKQYYGLATSIVSCSLAGCFILYEMIRVILLVL